MPLRETIKNTIATYKAVNSVEMTSYLIENHFDSLAESERLSRSVGPDDKDRRKLNVQRGRDSNDGLALLRIQLGVQALRP